MNKAAIPRRSVWENRWSEPTVEQLLEGLKEHHRKPIEWLLEQIPTLDGIDQRLQWYGKAWKWTLELTFRDAEGNDLGVLAYVVPRPEEPVVSIPLRAEVYDQLPMRRLNKYIRDGVRSAKCAVELYWAGWTPTSKSDAEHLFDLIKRKHRMCRGETSQQQQQQTKKA